LGCETPILLRFLLQIRDRIGVRYSRCAMHRKSHRSTSDRSGRRHPAGRRGSYRRYNGTDAIRPDRAEISKGDYEVLRANVIGASRRPLAEIFGDVGSGEFGKFERFFGYSLLHRKPRSEQFK
jgi:hypothetical protein